MNGKDNLNIELLKLSYPVAADFENLPIIWSKIP